jgi:hypothetical protein
MNVILILDLLHYAITNNISTLKIEAVGSSETLIPIFHISQRHIPEDHDLVIHRRENFKYYLHNKEINTNLTIRTRLSYEAESCSTLKCSKEFAVDLVLSQFNSVHILVRCFFKINFGTIILLRARLGLTFRFETKILCRFLI